jgi:hypothetical protein
VYITLTISEKNGFIDIIVTVKETCGNQFVNFQNSSTYQISGSKIWPNNTDCEPKLENYFNEKILIFYVDESHDCLAEESVTTEIENIEYRKSSVWILSPSNNFEHKVNKRSNKFTI